MLCAIIKHAGHSQRKEYLHIQAHFSVKFIKKGGFLAMSLKNQYLNDLLETVKKRNSGEPEFIQAVT